MGLEHSDIMLLSAILRILGQDPEQREEQRNFRLGGSGVEMKAPVERVSGLTAIEREIAAAAGLLKPPNSIPLPGRPAAAGPSLEELIRAVSKFEESERSRVVDVFE
jgi:hypothetical protein